MHAYILMSLSWLLSYKLLYSGLSVAGQTKVVAISFRGDQVADVCTATVGCNKEVLAASWIGIPEHFLRHPPTAESSFPVAQARSPLG